MKAKQPSVETINQALTNGAKSLTDISRHHGYKGSVSGCLGDKIKALVPDVSERLKANKSRAEAPPKKKSVKNLGKYPRHAKNPFREGSGYATAFDIFASFPKGIARSKLTEFYAKAVGKDLKKASYDIAVLLSPKSEKPSSERHKSCREGYGLIKDGSHYTIVIPKEG